MPIKATGKSSQILYNLLRYNKYLGTTTGTAKQNVSQVNCEKYPG